MTADRRSPTVAAHPVLKWVGGKGRLLPELLARLPQTFEAYHEPFVGGGALFFALAGAGRLERVYLSDANAALIDVYLALRDDVEGVIAALQPHRYERDHYYHVRAQRPDDLSLPERAARIIYLNKTCYNGLYRENRAGQFNVPFGRYKNPTICDEPNLRAVSAVLQGVDIARRRFDSVLGYAKKGDFVYFDPPYQPLTSTSNFTSYTKDQFGMEQQCHLAEVFKQLVKRGCYVLLSNSDSELVRNLYRDYQQVEIQAPRFINSKSAGRSSIAELLILSGPP